MLALRGDSTGIATGNALPLTLEAYDPISPEAGVVVSLPLPTTVRVDAFGRTHYRCTQRAGQGGAESLMTRSADGT